MSIADATYDSDAGLCGAYVSAALPIGIDACDENGPTTTSSYDFNNLLAVGTTYIFYTSTDACGNSDTTGHYITVNDTEAPHLVNANDLLIEVSGAGDLSETSWSLLDQNGDTLASGGGYSFGTTNYTVVDFDSLSQFTAPYLFNISTDGGSGLNDNVADWSILCNGATLSSGTLAAGLSSNNNAVLPCTDEPLAFFTASNECFYTISGTCLLYTSDAADE